MNHSYHVFASPKEGVSEGLLEEKIKDFLDAQIKSNHLASYRILKHSENGNFEGMPKYQVICDYDTEEQLKEGFAGMRPDLFREEPHLSLMNLVTDFRVGFSSDR
ncbi:MAG: hypothetical protein ACSHYA_01755 [Opitutaceae bacterium]